MIFASTMKGTSKAVSEGNHFSRGIGWIVGANYSFPLDREKKATAIAVGDEITERGYAIKTEMEGKT